MYIFQKRLKKRIGSRKYKYLALSNDNKSKFHQFNNLVKEDSQKKIEIEEFVMSPLKRSSSSKVPSTRGAIKRVNSVKTPKMKVNLSRRIIPKISEPPMLLHQIDEESGEESSKVPDPHKCKLSQ